MIDIEQFLMSLRRHKNADGKLNPIYLADTLQEEIEIIQGAIKHSQRWVGLTDEEVERIKLDGRDLEFVSMTALHRFARDIQAKLKEKNT
jgi:uncharacterized protein YecT (DUF1311 family)